MAETRRIKRLPPSKRRGESTHNIYRRYHIRDGREEPIPPGRKTAYVVLITHKGKQHRRYARTQGEAIRERDELERILGRGDDPSLATITFADYADAWIERYKGKSGSIRPESLREYQKELTQAKQFFARRTLASIRRMDAEAYREHVRTTRGRAGRPARAGTLRNAIAPLRAMFFDAHANGIVPRNPFSRLGLSDAPAEHAPGEVNEDRDPRRTFSEKELRCVIEELGKPTKPTGRPAPTDELDYWPLMAEFLAHTGLRISEAVALRWQDLDLKQRRVRVMGRIYRGKWSEPKSTYAKHPKRRISLSPGMATKLRKLQKARSGGPGDPVFASRDGTHLDPANLYKRVFKPAFRRAGVEWAGFHTFRHTCASLLFREGADPKKGAGGGGHANVVQVQRWLGHHSPGFTLATYIHLLSGDDVPDAAFFDTITAGSKNGSRTDPNKPAKLPRQKSAKNARLQDVDEQAA